MPARMVRFLAAAEQHAVRHDGGDHAAVARDGQHVLQEHQVGLLGAQRHLAVAEALGAELGLPRPAGRRGPCRWCPS